ncbi:MAG: hypothetical protein H0V13_12405 [Nocardioidaceae bacterium]|nr:hypothetical protein [Nocardioidaceae bacterium]
MQALLTLSLAATLLGGCGSSVPDSLGEALGVMPERPRGVLMQFVDVRETADQLDLGDDLGWRGSPATNWQSVRADCWSSTAGWCWHSNG